MEASDLAGYREQLADIELVLQADPANEEMQTMKAELVELITITETLLQQEQQIPTTLPTTTSSTSSPRSDIASSQSASGNSTPIGASTARSTAAHLTDNQPIYVPLPPTRRWTAGERCRALYASDGKHYEATVLSVAEGANGPIYSVEYKGYESNPPALLQPQDLKPVHDTKKYQKHHHQQVQGADDKKRGAGAISGGVHEGGSPGGAKKKKTTQPSEQVQKQMAWQSFSKGGSKKSKGPALKKSIFATPDNPEGKVGVVGSGKGMTQFQQRGKHIYGQAQQSNE
ncbi:hypothetical protein BGW38_002677 [Lunasporangiospora selenospora]|uniref:Tudor domain-containing protein n=1 Tax=Lunasporangiospora selenospora TaxID=979761 RepID=A0A9P6FSW6_9FUNG|nr:hypothetical protein BGW38_002677 [Lunasporangiospora selenospora]